MKKIGKRLNLAAIFIALFAFLFILCACNTEKSDKKVPGAFTYSMGFAATDYAAFGKIPFVYEGEITEEEYIGCGSDKEIATFAAIEKAKEYTNLYYMTLIITKAPKERVVINEFNFRINGNLHRIEAHCEVVPYQMTDVSIRSIRLQPTAESVSDSVEMTLEFLKNIEILDIFYVDSGLEIESVNENAKALALREYTPGKYSFNIKCRGMAEAASYTASNIGIKYRQGGETYIYYSVGPVQFMKSLNDLAA